MKRNPIKNIVKESFILNFLRRSFLSVWNRKGKSTLLFITLFVISNLVLAGLVIQAASVNATVYARQQLGGSVTLTTNLTAMQRSYQSGPGNVPKPTTAMANSLAHLPHVVSYNYFQNTMANADNFQYIQGQSRPAGARLMAQGQQMSSASMPDLQIEGDLQTQLAQDFVNGTAHLVSGRYITPQDADQHLALVSQQLADLNHWKLGDKFSLNEFNRGSTTDNTKEQFTIAGIFTVSASAAAGGPNLSIFNPENKIYTDYPDVMPLVSNGTSDGISQATYYLDDPMNIDQFKQEAKATGIDWNTFTLDAHDAQYQQMIGPIKNVASFAKTMVVLVGIAGAIMLGLIIMLSMRERKFEIGVLLALGERRWKVIGQLLAEILLIGTVAFSVSIFSGNLFSQNMANSLLSNEVTMAQQNQSNQPEPGRFMLANGINRQTQNVQPINHMSTQLSVHSLEESGFIGLLILILATLLPGLSIMRLRPREILSQHE